MKIHIMKKVGGKAFSPRSVTALAAHTGYEELMSTLSGIKSWSNCKIIRRNG